MKSSKTMNQIIQVTKKGQLSKARHLTSTASVNNLVVKGSNHQLIDLHPTRQLVMQEGTLTIRTRLVSDSMVSSDRIQVTRTVRLMIAMVEVNHRSR